MRPAQNNLRRRDTQPVGGIGHRLEAEQVAALPERAPRLCHDPQRLIEQALFWLRDDDSSRRTVD